MRQVSWIMLIGTSCLICISLAILFLGWIFSLDAYFSSTQVLSEDDLRHYSFEYINRHIIIRAVTPDRKREIIAVQALRLDLGLARLASALLSLSPLLLNPVIMLLWSRLCERHDGRRRILRLSRLRKPTR